MGKFTIPSNIHDETFFAKLPISGLNSEIN